MRREAAILAAGIALATFLWSGCAYGAFLVITKNGESLWVESVKEENGSVYCVPSAGGERRRFDSSELDGIVPKIERGKNYTKEQADTALGRIRKMLSRHPKLRKQLGMLEQEWKSVGSVDPEMGKKIDALVARFERGPTSPKLFQDIAVELDMIRFKDAAGAYANRIEQTLANMQAKLLDRNLGVLDAYDSSTKKPIEDFVIYRKLVEELKMVCIGDEIKVSLDKRLVDHRNAVLEWNKDTAKQKLFGNKTLAAYLDSVAILGDLKWAVADSDACRAGLDRDVEVFRNAADEALADYSLGRNGYPLNAEDEKLVAAAGQFISSMPIQSMPCDEQCLLFPETAPQAWQSGKKLRIPIRIVFNRSQPAKRVFSLKSAFVAGKSNATLSTTRLPPLDIRDGHADTVFITSLPVMVSGGGTRGVYVEATHVVVWLAFERPRSPGSTDMQQVAASFGCPLPVPDVRSR